MGGLAKRGNQRASVHLEFAKLPRPEHRKTDHYAVGASGHLIGGVKWYPQWRRYVFAPANDCIFDPLCMDQISEFCRKATEEHDDRIKHQRKNRTKSK